MKKRFLTTAVLGILTASAWAGGTLAAGPIAFDGSREFVRAICVGDGLYLTEGTGYSLCSDDRRDTSVLCTDAGSCTDAGFLRHERAGLPSGALSARAGLSAQ